MSVQASEKMVISLTDYQSHLYADGEPSSVYLAHQQYVVDRTKAPLLVHLHAHDETCKGSKHYVMLPGEEMREATL